MTMVLVAVLPHPLCNVNKCEKPTFLGKLVFLFYTKSFVREELASKLRYAQKDDVIIVGAGENNIDIGIGVAYLGNDAVAIHDACYIFRHNMNPKYISYCLRTDAYHKQIKKYVSSGKICAISAEGIGKARIPVPPLEIQNEIVRILDDYTEATQNLRKELEAEYEARLKQYEYYRDKLLNFSDVFGGGHLMLYAVDWKTLLFR